jgi:hypothetical protein
VYFLEEKIVIFAGQKEARTVFFAQRLPEKGHVRPSIT